MSEKTYTEEEVMKAIQAARIAQMQADYGNQWFIEALSHTADLVRRGAFPEESHQMGQEFYKQFQKPAQPKQQEKKPEDEDKEPEDSQKQ